MDAQLKTFVDTVDKWLTAEDITINIDACVGCNNCGQACAWFLETDDPRLHPKTRADVVRDVYESYISPTGKVLNALGLKKGPTVEDLKGAMDTFWKCTACGRCTLACPMGISTRRLIRIARAAYTDSGLALSNPTLKAIIENSRDKRHSFGLSVAQVFGRAALFQRHFGLDAPIDVKGAEYLFVCPAAGNAKIPDLGIFMIEVLNAAGISYTMTPSVIDTGTEVDHITVEHGLSKQMLLEWEAAAERLEVKALVVAECGCDVRTIYHESTETLGRPFKVPVISIDSLFERAIDSGQIPIEPIDESVTFHDPCYVTRISGLGERYRRMLPKLVKDFREMTPNREYNYCCNGGSGGMKLPENTELRRKISRIKADQIKNTGADLVTTPCAVCYGSLKDTTDFYKIAKPGERRVRMFFEVVNAAMRKALIKSGDMERTKEPALFKGQSQEWREKHSMLGLLETWLKDPTFAPTMEWLKKDEVVKNFGARTPGFNEELEKLEAGIPKALAV